MIAGHQAGWKKQKTQVQKRKKTEVMNTGALSEDVILNSKVRDSGGVPDNIYNGMGFRAYSGAFHGKKRSGSVPCY